MGNSSSSRSSSAAGASRRASASRELDKFTQPTGCGATRSALRGEHAPQRTNTLCMCEYASADCTRRVRGSSRRRGASCWRRRSRRASPGARRRKAASHRSVRSASWWGMCVVDVGLVVLRVAVLTSAALSVAWSVLPREPERVGVLQEAHLLRVLPADQAAQDSHQVRSWRYRLLEETDGELTVVSRRCCYVVAARFATARRSGSSTTRRP